MGRVIAAESENITAPPSAVATKPVHVDTLAACIKEIGHCVRVTANVLRRFAPSPVFDELSALVEKRVAAVEAALAGEEQ